MSLPSETQSKTRYRIPAMTSMRKLRIRAGLSRESLAVLAGISPGWLGTIEREPSFLTLPIAEKVAAALGCAPADLFPDGDG